MAIYCNKCGTMHECSVCPACHGSGCHDEITDDLRAKFEEEFSHPPYEWSFRRHNAYGAWPDCYKDYNVQCAWAGYVHGHASRDAEVEALRKDAERYRLLRSCSGYQAPFCVTQNIGHDWIISRREELDEAIDAAMREGG